MFGFWLPPISSMRFLSLLRQLCDLVFLDVHQFAVRHVDAAGFIFATKTRNRAGSRRSCTPPTSFTTSCPRSPRALIFRAVRSSAPSCSTEFPGIEKDQLKTLLPYGGTLSPLKIAF